MWSAVAGSLVIPLGLGGYWLIQDSHRKQESEKRRAQIAKSLFAQEQQREKKRQDDLARRERFEEDIKKNPIKSTDLSIEEIVQKGTGTKRQETLEAKYARGVQDAITCRNALIASLKDPPRTLLDLPFLANQPRDPYRCQNPHRCDANRSRLH